MEQQKDFQLGDLIRKIGLLIKKNWILITAVILVFVLGGVGYSYLRKPTYIASRQAIYGSQLDPSEPNLYDHTSAVNMMDTFIDFCDEPVVLNRANYYYGEYLKAKQINPDYKVSDYVTIVETERKGMLGDGATLPSYVINVDANGYKLDESKDLATNVKAYVGDPVLDTYETKLKNGTLELESYFDAGNVSVTAEETDEMDVPKFDIFVSCKDKNVKVAQEKAEIYVMAIKYEASKVVKVHKLETHNTSDPSVIDQTRYVMNYQYFEALVRFEDFGNLGYSTDMSKTKIILVAGLLGVVVAALALALVYMLDRTVRNKEELETITGSNVLAVISLREGGSENG